MTLHPAQVQDWARFAVVIGSRAYRSVLLTLAALALVPSLIGWSSYVVHSGSMEPSIEVGDVAVGRTVEVGDKVAVGRVYTFQDPATRAERIMLHRVVERRDEGTYTTAGDANNVTDSTPVTPADLDSRAVLLVPFIGLPVVWFVNGELTKLALWLLLTIGAFIAASRTIDGEPPKWTLLRLVRDAVRRRASGGGRTSGDRQVSPEGTPGQTPQKVARTAAVAGVLVLGLLGTTLGTANATFTARSAATGNTWTAGAGLQPYNKAVLASSPKGYWLLDGNGTAIEDRTDSHRDGYLSGAVTPGAAGGLPNNPGSALRFNGGRAMLHPSIGLPSATYSIELWFRTTATREGYLAGYENSTDATSSGFDRTLQINAQGRLVFGNWTNNGSMVTTPASYNDGKWHHVVVTGTPQYLFGPHNGQIFVDGQRVASGQTPSVGIWFGIWRIGAGTIERSWFTSRGASFIGDLDQVAIYDRALTAAEVAAHYAAR